MKTAIITGASSGLGREVARQLTDVDTRAALDALTGQEQQS